MLIQVWSLISGDKSQAPSVFQERTKSVPVWQILGTQYTLFPKETIWKCFLPATADFVFTFTFFPVSCLHFVFCFLTLPCWPWMTAGFCTLRQTADLSLASIQTNFLMLFNWVIYNNVTELHFQLRSKYFNRFSFPCPVFPSLISRTLLSAL